MKIKYHQHSVGSRLKVECQYDIQENLQQQLDFNFDKVIIFGVTSSIKTRQSFRLNLISINTFVDKNR